MFFNIIKEGKPKCVLEKKVFPLTKKLLKLTPKLPIQSTKLQLTNHRQDFLITLSWFIFLFSVNLFFIFLYMSSICLQFVNKIS